MSLYGFIKKRKFVLLGIIILLIIPGIIFARSGSLPLIGKKPEIQTVSPSRNNLTEDISVSGSIDASEKASVHFLTGGLMTWVGVKEGDTVRKYQALASLDRRQLQKSLQTQLNNYMLQRTSFETTQDEYKDERDKLILTDAMKRILDTAQYNLNNSVINVEVQDLAIRLATITSPIDGIVTDITSPYAGVNVAPTDQFMIVNPKTLYFSADIDETDIAKVKPGLPVKIILDAYPDQTIDSTVSEISFTPAVGSSGTVYEAKMVLTPLESQQFRIGLNGEAQIITRTSDNAMSLPITAFESIDTSSGEGKIKVLENNQPVEKTVGIGIVTDEQVEIVSGLSESDKVIIPSDVRR